MDPTLILLLSNYLVRGSSSSVLNFGRKSPEDGVRRRGEERRRKYFLQFKNGITSKSLHEQTPSRKTRHYGSEELGHLHSVPLRNSRPRVSPHSSRYGSGPGVRDRSRFQEFGTLPYRPVRPFPWSVTMTPKKHPRPP